MRKTVIPFGPQHPVLPEPIHLKLTIQDERITEAIPALGYVHRGLERLADVRDYHQMIQVVAPAGPIPAGDVVRAASDPEPPPLARALRRQLRLRERLHAVLAHPRAHHGHQRGDDGQPRDRLGERHRRGAPQPGRGAAALGAQPARLGGGGVQAPRGHHAGGLHGQKAHGGQGGADHGAGLRARRGRPDAARQRGGPGRAPDRLRRLQGALLRAGGRDRRSSRARTTRSARP